MGLMQTIEGYAMKAVKTFLNLRFWRLEWCLYAASLCAFGFCFFIVFEVFRGHVQIFENMQTGSNTYKGSALMADMEKRADFATFFPGILMSTVVCGFFFVFTLLFLGLAVLTTPQFWTWLWGFRYVGVF